VFHDRQSSTASHGQCTALDAQVSSDLIRQVSRKVENRATYPAGQLANSLKLVARLIGGGLPTRVFYVSQGGYDTHTNQTGTHERLLRELGDSVKAFVDDMKSQGNFGRVLVMTFSEFGRRVAENASSGTDHGAAAPMFVIVKSVLHCSPSGPLNQRTCRRCSRSGHSNAQAQTPIDSARRR